MLKKSLIAFAIVSLIINLVLIYYIFNWHNSNLLNTSDFYIKNIYPVAFDLRERGTPIERYYIEKFLTMHKDYIKGYTLEMRDPLYIRKFGDKITKYDIFDYADEKATFTGDIQKTENMPSDKYDTYICTQMLYVPYDTKAALKSANKMLKKGGALIVTLPFIQKVLVTENFGNEHWRITEPALKRLLEEAGFEVKDIRSYGNSMATVLSLEGIAVEDIKDKKNLDIYDFNYPVEIAALAIKK